MATEPEDKLAGCAGVTAGCLLVVVILAFVVIVLIAATHHLSRKNEQEAAIQRGNAYADKLEREVLAMKQLTYDAWKLAGYQVRKGERASGRDKEGKATFTRDQVEEIQEQPRSNELDYDLYNHDIDPDGRR